MLDGRTRYYNRIIAPNTIKFLIVTYQQNRLAYKTDIEK